MGYAHGTQWTDESIKERVLEVVDALELNRMPSRAECENYYRNSALTNAVSKRKGWYQLAFELGLPVKDSETTFGKRHEAIAAESLMAMGYEVRRMAQNFPYDLLVEDCVKVDVKSSKLYHGKNGNFYSFNLEKDYATCDFYLLYAISDDENERTMVVPSKDVIATTQISIGETKSKYYVYEDAWELIELAVKFWSSVNVR